MLAFFTAGFYMMENVKYKGDTLFRKDEIFFINKVYEYTENNCIYHSHDFIEINYVFAGKGCQIIADKKYAAAKSDVFIISNGKGHVFYKTDPDCDLVIYNIIFMPDFLDDSLMHGDDFTSIFLSYLFRSDFSCGSTGEYLRLDSEEQDKFDILVNSMYQEYCARKEGYISILRAYLIELIVLIMRHVHKRAQNGRTSQKEYIIEKAIRYLQDHYADSINLEELSLKFYLNKNYFCRLFKTYTGMTTSEYIQSIRIDKACILLQKTDKKVLEIAYSVGFRDYKFFNSVFKRLKGMCAGEYRKLTAGKTDPYPKTNASALNSAQG